MFREMRRKERQLSAEAALAILEKCSWGTLSTVGEDSWPYGVPVNYAVIGNALYFHCAKTGHKLDNISHCDKVSFTASSLAAAGDTAIFKYEVSNFYTSSLALHQHIFLVVPHCISLLLMLSISS